MAIKNMLEDVTAKKVSYVDKAANKRRFLLIKSEEGVDGSMLTHEQLIKVLKADPADATAILKEAGVPDSVHTEVLKATELLKPLADTLTAASTATVIKQLEAIKPVESPIAKADFDALLTRVTKAEGENKTLADLLQKSADDAKNKEFITKAASFDSLPTVVPDTLGPVLKECSDKLSKESYDLLEGVLKSANEVAKTGGLFKQHTLEQGIAKGSAEEQLWALAKGMVAKGDTGLTEYQAFAKACTDNPGLYAQMNAEKYGN